MMGNATTRSYLAAALTITGCAAVFCIFFHVVLWTCIDACNLYYWNLRALALGAHSGQLQPSRVMPSGPLPVDPLISHIVTALNSYGVGYNYGFYFTSPPVVCVREPANWLFPEVFVALLGFMVVVSAILWKSLARTSFDTERRSFVASVIRSSLATMLVLMTCAGAASAFALVLIRFLQCVLNPTFKENYDTAVTYTRDHLGVTITTSLFLLISLTFYMLVCYPRIKFRVLVGMSRCGHCGYPSTPHKPCSECGFAPPVLGH